MSNFVRAEGLEIGNTTNINRSGIIFKNGTRFIHDFNYGNNGTVTTNGFNIFIGLNAGNFTMGLNATQAFDASANIGIGFSSLNANTIGCNNVGIGYLTLSTNTTGNNNIAIGAFTLNNNITGFSNTMVGYATGFSNTSGSYNTVVGANAFEHNLTGNFNVIIGYYAGRHISDNSNLLNPLSSIFIGSYTKAQTNNSQNEIVIGHNTIGNGSNSVTLGNDNITKTILKGNVGFGTNNPQARIHISSGGLIRMDSFGTDIFNIETGTNNFSIKRNETARFILTANDDILFINYNNMGLGIQDATAKLDIDGQNGHTLFRLRKSYTPAGTEDMNGNIGTIVWDNNYIYVKTSAGWKRSALSIF